METDTREAAMRQAQVRTAAIIGGMLWLASMIGTGRAEPGFDEKYQRDFNIFNPINQYQSTNPLNPINAYDPANPFNPINQFDPGNPANPINQFNPHSQTSYRYRARAGVLTPGGRSIPH
jgi:hypothetical protein